MSMQKFYEFFDLEDDGLLVDFLILSSAFTLNY
jgi:hypothetical protein